MRDITKISKCSCCEYNPIYHIEFISEITLLNSIKHNLIEGYCYNCRQKI